MNPYSTNYVGGNGGTYAGFGPAGGYTGHLPPQRQFFPSPFFSPFFFPPFFPRRRFIPFFLFSPFFFFPFREGEERDGMYYAQHISQPGETMGSLAQLYNVPQPVLEVMNPHVQDPDALVADTVVQIPRMDRMHFQKMYLEQETPEEVMPVHAQSAMMPPAGSSGYPGL